MSAREVGRVVGLWRYPVKSMAAEALDAVEVGWHGLAGDRRWAFVRGAVPRSGFPWMTIREDAAMLSHVPRFVEPGRPDQSRTLVRTPAGEELDVVDPVLAASLGDDVRVIKQDRGVFDAMPLSLITTQAIAELEVLVGFGLDPQRFRPNLLVEADEREDAWVGRVLRIGGMAMRVDQRDERCVIVNIDPVSGARDPSVLRTLAQERSACIGIYGSTVERGRVAIGDAVVVEH
jgi:MOSC domain-containing protein